MSFPPCPSPQALPLSKPHHRGIICSRPLASGGVKMNNPWRGGVEGGAQRGARSLQRGGERWVGVTASLPPSLPWVPAWESTHGAALSSTGLWGTGKACTLLPHRSFALCLSFPVGKQASPPPPWGCAGFGTIANLCVIILGAESSITQSRDC